MKKHACYHGVELWQVFGCKIDWSKSEFYDGGWPGDKGEDEDDCIEEDESEGEGEFFVVDGNDSSDDEEDGEDACWAEGGKEEFHCRALQSRMTRKMTVLYIKAMSRRCCVSSCSVCRTAW